MTCWLSSSNGGRLLESEARYVRAVDGMRLPAITPETGLDACALGIDFLRNFTKVITALETEKS